MRRIRLLLEYDGTAYHGWQSQKNDANLQDLLEVKLAILLGQPTRIDGASRTDAGVHARGQVAAFNTDSDKSTDKIQFSLNGLLPPDVRVREVSETVEVFDPRRDSQSKTYRYVYWDARQTSPFWRNYSFHARGQLDEKAMHEAAQALVGEHDFSSFRAAGCSAKTPVRRMLAASVKRKGERVTFEITGQAFLQQMVRILAGTLHDIGLGKRPVSDMAMLLSAKDRQQASKTAPAQGLILWKIEYGAIPRPGRKLKGEAVPEPETPESGLK